MHASKRIQTASLNGKKVHYEHAELNSASARCMSSSRLAHSDSVLGSYASGPRHGSSWYVSAPSSWVTPYSQRLQFSCQGVSMKHTLAQLSNCQGQIEWSRSRSDGNCVHLQPFFLRSRSQGQVRGAAKFVGHGRTFQRFFSAPRCSSACGRRQGSHVAARSVGQCRIFPRCFSACVEPAPRCCSACGRLAAELRTIFAGELQLRHGAKHV